MTSLAASRTSVVSLVVVRCTAQPNRPGTAERSVWTIRGLVPPEDLTTGDDGRVMFLVGELLSWDSAFIGVGVQAAIAFHGLSKPVMEYSDRALRAETTRLADQYQHVLYDRAFDVAAHLANLIRVDIPIGTRTMEAENIRFDRLELGPPGDEDEGVGSGAD